MDHNFAHRILASAPVTAAPSSPAHKQMVDNFTKKFGKGRDEMQTGTRVTTFRTKAGPARITIEAAVNNGGQTFLTVYGEDDAGEEFVRLFGHGNSVEEIENTFGRSFANLAKLKGSLDPQVFKAVHVMAQQIKSLI